VDFDERAKILAFLWLHTEGNLKSKGFFCKSFTPSQSNIVVMAETIDDEYLVKQFIRGDKSAFETILKRYSHISPLLSVP